MASTSENTFGAKLRRAQDLVSYLQGFSGYAPPRQQETVVSMNGLITSILSANSAVATAQQQYKTAVNNRLKAFRGTTGSINTLTVQIRGAVESQYGKKSSESASLGAIIKRMRATKLVNTPTDPTKETQQTTISQSERSFGSITQTFSDMVNSLQQFVGYTPSNTSIRIAGLQATVTQLTTLNNSVAQRTQGYKTAMTNRNSGYADLKDRIQRIKSYVKSQYGPASTEYGMIKGIRI